jgi:hypothetical protein
MRHFLYFSLVFVCIISVASLARMMLSGVDYNAFFGFFFVPLAVMIRNALRLYFFPMEKYNFITATSQDDTAFFKKWNFIVFFIGIFIGIFILWYLAK